MLLFALCRSLSVSLSLSLFLPLSLCVVGRPMLWGCAFPETLQYRHRHNKFCCEICINTCQHCCSLDKPVRPWSQVFGPWVCRVKEKASASKFDNINRTVRDKTCILLSLWSSLTVSWQGESWNTFKQLLWMLLPPNLNLNYTENMTTIQHADLKSSYERWGWRTSDSWPMATLYMISCTDWCFEHFSHLLNPASKHLQCLHLKLRN